MKFIERLTANLAKVEGFVDEEGNLNKQIIINRTIQNVAELIPTLLEDEEIKAKFFHQVEDTEVLVFDKEHFITYVEQKDFLTDSFTKFGQKIGYQVGGQYLRSRRDVVLVWPYKDCVLEGGQTKEETKRNEIFFNQTLAADEITELLDQKVFTNAKVIGKSSDDSYGNFTTAQLKDFLRERALKVSGKLAELKARLAENDCRFDGFSRDSDINEERGLPDDTITDNLIIKGNNLMALHSIKDEFRGKIKLIFIDPPYNEETDDFRYNDSFNESTWLTFMKNRLEVAMELLSEDGSMWIILDNNESHILKVLCDDLFGKEHFVGTVIWRTGTQKSNVSGFSEDHNQIVIYGKQKKTSTGKKGWLPKKQADPTKQSHFKPPPGPTDPDGKRGRWYDGYDIQNPKYRPTLQYTLESPNGSTIPHPPNGWRWELETINEMIEAGKNGEYHKSGNLIFVNDDDSKKDTKVRCVKYLEELKGIPSSSLWDNTDYTGSNRQAKNTLKQIFPESLVPDLFETPKPERLLMRILELSTDEQDIVLDFFLGSGTTAAVAHKLSRQYIGIEQMDTDEILVRMKLVIEGDGVGISHERAPGLPAIDWNGGGTFTYLELKKYNEDFIQRIMGANSKEAIEQIWVEMKEKSFLHYNLDLKKHQEQIQSFKDLDLPEQKHHLVGILDKNQLFVNLSSLNDSDFECTDEEKYVTTNFYKLDPIEEE